MCGRYVTVSSPALLAERFDVTELRLPEEALEPSYNVAPRADVPVIAERRHGSEPRDPGTHERVLDVVRWGLVPFWAKDPKIGDRMINARADKILTSNAFKRPFERRRCIVPADGFYEWEKIEVPGKPKPTASPARKGRSGPRQPWFIRRRDGEPLAFAGLWETWRDPEKDDARLRTCVIITTDANELLAPIHDRMPVVLPESEWETWLDVENHDTAKLHELLVPSPASELEMWPVSTLVNKADNNGPELIEVAQVASA
jgi:putative SOS response-associated peptidase YedK